MAHLKGCCDFNQVVEKAKWSNGSSAQTLYNNNFLYLAIALLCIATQRQF